MTLFKNGKRDFKIVHRLVAEAFLEKESGYNEVNHIDLNKSNNNVSNLEWCNRSQNVNHFYKSQKTSSIYKGVSYQKDRRKYVAYIDLHKKRITLGRFDTEKEAKEYRDNFIEKLKETSYESII